MTDTTPTLEKPPLGVGQILSETFSLLFGNIVAVAFAAFVPILISIVIGGMLLGFDVALGATEPDFVTGNIWPAFAINILVSLAIYGVVTAIIVQLAYDAKAGRGTNFAGYASAAVSTLVPNVLQTLAISVMAGFGMILLIVPGLWIYGVFAVTVPALVIERLGFGAMSRSAELTKEYRWPVIGTIVVVGIAASVINLIPAFIVGWLITSFGTGFTIVAVLLSAVLYTFTYGLISISLALIYARLREIKEGVGVESLASVFE